MQRLRSFGNIHESFIVLLFLVIRTGGKGGRASEGLLCFWPRCYTSVELAVEVPDIHTDVHIPRCSLADRARYGERYFVPTWMGEPWPGVGGKERVWG